MGKCQKIGVLIRYTISVWLSALILFTGCVGSSRRDPGQPLEPKGAPLTQEKFLECSNKPVSDDSSDKSKKAKTTVLPWWTAFNEPQLNFFVELALEKN